jgi:hypothetical protein
MKLQDKDSKRSHARKNIDGFFIPLYGNWIREVGLQAATFLAVAAYWQNIKGPGEWWYKRRDAKRGPDGKLLPPCSRTEQSFEWEAGLSRSAQETARAVARERGFIEEKLVGKRLYYRINLKLVEDWSKELNSVRKGDFQPVEWQESAIDLGKVSHEYGEISAPKAKNKQIPFQKSRSRDTSESVGVTPPMLKDTQAAAPREEAVTRPTNEGGVLCWDDNDRVRAHDMISRWGLEKVNAAANKVEARGTRPLASRVYKELLNSEKPNNTEQTRGYLSQYLDRTPNETKIFGAIQQKIKTMRLEELKDYQRAYIAGEGAAFTRSLNVTANEFSNVSERAMFKRWLERQLRQVI